MIEESIELKSFQAKQDGSLIQHSLHILVSQLGEHMVKRMSNQL